MNKPPSPPKPKRLIVGISGASGIIYGIRLLEVLRELDIESHLVISKSSEMTLSYETDLKLDDVKALADHVHAFKKYRCRNFQRLLPHHGHDYRPLLNTQHVGNRHRRHYVTLNPCR